MTKRCLLFSCTLLLALLAQPAFAAQKTPRLKRGEVLIDTDQKTLYGIIETEIDYAGELAEPQVFYQDNISMNLTAGPSALPANKPLTTRTHGKARFANPLRVQYAVTHSDAEDLSCKIPIPALTDLNKKSFRYESVFNSFASTIRYHRAKEFRNIIRLTGLNENSIIYDAYFAGYITLNNKNQPLASLLIRARYNHLYALQYDWNYPHLQGSSLAPYRGELKENLTYLSLPYAEAPPDTARYSFAGWLVEDGGKTGQLAAALPLPAYFGASFATASNTALPLASNSAAYRSR